MRRKRLNCSRFNYEKLEDKILLIISATVTPAGTLSITGTAEGIVDIDSLGNEQFWLRTTMELKSIP